MTDLRKAAEMALDAMLSEYSTGGENKYSPWDVIEALRQALAQPEQEKESTVCAVDSRLLLGRSNNFTKETENRLCDIERRLAAIETQPALAQPEQEPEPVAYLDAVDNKTVYVAPNRKRWLDPHEDKEWLQFHYDHCHDTPLYTAPPKREWVGLTVDEILDCYKDNLDRTMFVYIVQTIEAKLKEKNT